MSLRSPSSTGRSTSLEKYSRIRRSRKDFFSPEKCASTHAVSIVMLTSLSISVRGISHIGLPSRGHFLDYPVHYIWRPPKQVTGTDCDVSNASISFIQRLFFLSFFRALYNTAGMFFCAIPVSLAIIVLSCSPFPFSTSNFRYTILYSWGDRYLLKSLQAAAAQSFSPAISSGSFEVVPIENELSRMFSNQASNCMGHAA